MHFYTNGGSGIEERMRIDSSGNVLINSGYIKLGGFSFIGEDLSDLDSLTIASDHTESIHFAHHNSGSYTTNMIIDNSGNVGIGTTTPDAKLEITTLRENGIRLSSSDITAFPDELLSGIEFYSPDTSGGAGVKASIQVKYNDGDANSYMTFSTGTNTEKMRITSGGDVFSVSNTSGISSAITAGAGTSLAVFIGKHSATNGSYASGTNSFIVWSNGNVVNTNNSYGAISDAKLKENIVDTTPKLDDLMKVKVRNYNLIGDDKKQIGVVAQELEEVFPAMIDESIDYEDKEITDEEGNISTEKVDLGTTTKSVKYSVFVPMLIKSIQELKADNDNLRERIQTLENQ
jgi:hypothetical protein